MFFLEFLVARHGQTNHVRVVSATHAAIGGQNQEDDFFFLGMNLQKGMGHGNTGMRKVVYK